MREVQARSGRRTAEMQKAIDYWSAGSPSYRWVQLGADYVERRPQSNPRNTRIWR